jgi:2-oxoisovalerate dehydrogenase E1 component
MPSRIQAAAPSIAARALAAFVRGHVIRYSHSLSDDDKLYRSAAEREADGMRDPLARMQMRLLREGILSAEEINALEKSLDREASEAADRALEAPLPPIAEITKYVYSEDLDPTSAAFDSEQTVARGAKYLLPVRARCRGPWRT